MRGRRPVLTHSTPPANSLNWQLVAHACFRQSIVFCTAYDTLGEDGLTFSLDEPEVVGMFTNADLLGMLARVVGNTPHLKYVIYDGKDEAGNAAKLDAVLQERGGKVLTLDEVIELGKTEHKEPTRPSPDTLACIMYTSGSTGRPKGVLLKHKNCVSSVGTVVKLLGPFFAADDTLLAYLPLAHILEFVAECSMIHCGITLGYGRVKTLTSASVRNCKGDLQEFRPTLLVGVPTVFETIRKGILAKVNQGGALKKTVFNAALSLKGTGLPVVKSLADLVFGAVRAQTGGRLRLSLSGGAPISKATQSFINLSLVQILQGYGMTESSAMCSICTPEFNSMSSVGVISPAIEVKLVDVPDAGYRATNNPPQGEVWIRGPAVCAGYYKNPELTAETINEEGWLMTGDVGQFNRDGTLSLIDRKKNLVKLAGGEYIGLEALESTYKSNELVGNVCVVADSNASKPMAVVFPNEGNLRSRIDAGEVPGVDAGWDLHRLCDSTPVSKYVLASLGQTAKEARFKPLQTLQTVLLVPDELDMTAAQKIERKKVEAKYKSQISKIYP